MNKEQLKPIKGQKSKLTKLFTKHKDNPRYIGRK